MSKIIIIGTSHVSRKSTRQVKETIAEAKPDCVAVELCPKRYYALLHYGKISHVSLRYGLMVWLFAWLQKKLGERFGILPGSEMLAAINAGKAVGARIVLIDMDIEEILQKLRKISLREKMKLVFGFLSLRGKIDLEKPEEKIVKEFLNHVRKNLPEFYKVLVRERNFYMAEWIKKLRNDFKKIVVVVGLGHEYELKKLLKTKN